MGLPPKQSFKWMNVLLQASYHLQAEGPQQRSHEILLFSGYFLWNADETRSFRHSSNNCSGTGKLVLAFNFHKLESSRKIDTKNIFICTLANQNCWVSHGCSAEELCFLRGCCACWLTHQGGAELASNWRIPIRRAALSLGGTWVKPPGPAGGGRHRYTCQISNITGHLPARRDNSCSSRVGLQTKKREAQKGGERERRQRCLLLDQEHVLNGRKSTCINSFDLSWQGISTVTCRIVTRCHIDIRHINPSYGSEGACAMDLNLWATDWLFLFAFLISP